MSVKTSEQLQQDLIDQLSDKPVWDPVEDKWSCPPGYSHPKCPGCGHNYFDAKPVLKRLARNSSLCHWCIRENQEWMDSCDED